MASGTKYTYQEVKSIVNDLDYRLLSSHYVNARTKIDIMDKDMYKYSVTLNNLISGKKPIFTAQSNPYVLYNIQQFLINKQSKTILLSDNYDYCKQKLCFKCNCGAIYLCSVDKLVNRNKIECNDCSMKKKGMQHRINTHTVKNAFINAGLEPLFDNYSGCNEKLLCKNSEGYIGLLSYANLKQGNLFDIVGKYNPYSINNIKHYINKYNLRCHLISDAFKNAGHKLQFQCNCGKIYKTSWKVFMSFHNDRCPTCSKKQSKHALIVEEYLINNNYNYEKEYTYEDCRDKNVLLFDYAVFKNNNIFLIEVDGETHYIPAWGGKEGLQLQQKRDEIKNQYCINNNIKLIRISYIEINNGLYISKLKKELSENIG